MLIAKKYLSLLLVVSTMSAVRGFSAMHNIFDAFKPGTELQTMAKLKIAQKFKIRMDVGNKNEKHRMNLDGLTIEMLQHDAPKNAKVGLPGADGPHPQTSTGALALNVISGPSFIDLFGTQRVKFEKGCWEMIWRLNHYCGSVICGFDVPNSIKRNDASLPSGKIYLSFPIWSQEGLAIRQAERVEAEKKAKEFATERDEEFHKYTTETNLFKKAMHYRNAVAAVEKIDFTGIRSLSQLVPLDGEIVPIGNGLVMSMKGTIFHKAKSFLGAKHTELGKALLKPVQEEPEENKLRP